MPPFKPLERTLQPRQMREPTRSTESPWLLAARKTASTAARDQPLCPMTRTPQPGYGWNGPKTTSTAGISTSGVVARREAEQRSGTNAFEDGRHGRLTLESLLHESCSLTKQRQDAYEDTIYRHRPRLCRPQCASPQHLL